MEEIRVPVIDAKFCMPHALPLIVEPPKKIFTSTLFKVLDASGNQLLKIAKGNSHFKNRDILILDANDSPLATLRHKTFSWHDTWRVFRGNNTQEQDALFWVKRQDEVTLNVFMGPVDREDKKHKKERSNFDVVGSPPTFYMGDTRIADVNNNFSWGEDSSKKSSFKIRIGAGMDYVFVIALLIIYTEMPVINHSSHDFNAGVIVGAARA